MRDVIGKARAADSRMLIAAGAEDLPTSLPAQRRFGCRGRRFCVCDLAAEESLEVLSQHDGGTAFDNLSNFGRQADAAKTGKASHSRQEDIDDQPLDVIVRALWHDEMCDEPRIARGSLQRV